jgi:hypothetical protein
MGNPGQTATFTAGTHNIDLSNNGNDFNIVSIVSGADVTLKDANRIALGASTISGNLSVTALNGPITQTGALLVNGVGKTATFSAAGAGNDIILADSGNDFTTILLSGNNANIHDANGLAFGASTLSGNLFVTANGTINQSGALTFTTPGTIASFNAGASHDINLGNPGNDFATVAIVSGNNVTLRDANALDIGASTISGNFNVTANGFISQSGAIIANGVGKIATFDAGTANDIFLNNPGNDFSTVAILSGNDVILQDANSIDLGPSTVSASFSVTAHGDITESGALHVTSGPSSFTIDTATGDVLLGSQANDFGNQSVTVSAVNGGSVRDVTFRNINAAAAFPTLPALLRNLSVEFNAAPIVISTPFTLSGDLSLSAGGPILQTVAFSVNGSTTLTAGGNDINLGAANDFGGAVNIVSADNVLLNDVNGLTVGGNVSGNLATTAGGPIGFNALTVGGNLTAVGSGLSDNGNVNITGTSTLNAGGGNISFTHADNFGGAVTVANANDVTLNDINALTVGGNVGGNLTTTAGGPIAFNTLSVGGNLNANGDGLSDNGDVTVAGTSALNAGGADISFTHNDNFVGAVTVANANNVTINDINALTVGGNVGGNLTATAAGALAFNTLSVGGNLSANGNGLSDNGDVTVAGTSALNGGGADISFTHNDNFVGAVTVANANNVTLNDINALTVGGTIGGNLSATAGGALAFNTLSVGGNLSANGNGVSDNGDVTVNGLSALNGGGGNISFTHNDNFVGAVTVANANNVTLNDINALTVGGTIGGNLSATAGGALAFNALNVGGNLTANGNGLSDNGNVSIAGTSALNAGGGDISFTFADDFGGAVSIANAHNVTLTDINAINLGASTVSGFLTVTAGGDITDSGNLVVANAATFKTAGGNSIILDQSGNTFNGPVSFGSTGGGNLNNVTVVDTTAFDVTGIAVNGTFSVTAGGPVTQSGSIVASDLAVTSAGNVTLNGANQVGTVAIDAQGAIQYNNVSSIAIGAVNGVNGLNSHDNNITVTTVNGNITVNNTSESVDVEAGTGILTFTTGGADNGITIASGASVHGEGGVTFTADNMDIAGTLSSGAGNMVLQPLSLLRPLHFGSTDVAGSLNFSQNELDHITSHDLTIGNINTGPISGSASIFKPVTVDQLHILGGGIQIDVQLFANQLASLLAGAILPVPRVEVTSFSGAGIDLEQAAKIMEPDAIGTLFLQVPFVPVEAKKYKVEEASKWTSGRIVASGTTAGPQTPR